MWHAFGGLGHWTEWHAYATNMREVLEAAKEKIHVYGHAFVENPAGDLTWFAGRFGVKTEIRPYKPLQSDWGVGEP